MNLFQEKTSSGTGNLLSSLCLSLNFFLQFSVKTKDPNPYPANKCRYLVIRKDPKHWVLVNQKIIKCTLLTQKNVLCLLKVLWSVDKKNIVYISESMAEICCRATSVLLKVPRLLSSGNLWYRPNPFNLSLFNTPFPQSFTFPSSSLSPTSCSAPITANLCLQQHFLLKPSPIKLILFFKQPFLLKPLFLSDFLLQQHQQEYLMLRMTVHSIETPPLLLDCKT